MADIQSLLAIIPEGGQFTPLRNTLTRISNSFPAKLSSISIARLQGWITEIESGTGRLSTEISDDIFKFVVGETAIAEFVETAFSSRSLTLATAGETEAQRLTRITNQLLSGERTFFEFEQTLDQFGTVDRTLTQGIPSGEPAPRVLPGQEPIPSGPVPGDVGGDVILPPPPTDVTPGIPSFPSLPSLPSIPSVPEPPPFDFLGAASALLPFLPSQLLNVFADAWAEFNDTDIALGVTRQSPLYDQFFPGIRRSDGTLRMSEQEYIATKEAFGISLLELGVNPNLFSGRFVELIEGNVSAAEFQVRLNSVFSGILNNLPEVRAFYANSFGINMTDEAIFASVLDPEIGQGILNQTISIAQVGGEAALQGFSIGLGFAERLANAGLTQQSARGLFADASFRIPTLATLADRFNAPDQTLDLGEFVDAAFFGSASQINRQRRLLSGEIASFSSQDFAAQTDGRITGLEER